MKSLSSRCLACLLPLAAVLSSAAVADAQVVQVTEQHKVFEAEVGTWDAQVTMFIPGVAEPMTSKGGEINESFAGGLWLISRFDMEFGGQEFKGRGQFGYDPVKKKYVGTWIDNMTSHLATLEGDYDASTKTMTMMMHSTGPDGEPMVAKTISKMNEDGTRTYTMFQKEDGDEWIKMMEVIYTKR